MYTPDIYKRLPGVVFGFHGCEREVAERILQGQSRHLLKSQNDYDWLGSGVYFWENSPSRAEEFARKKTNIGEPFVIGAVLDLGQCLDFLDFENLQLLKTAYQVVKNNMILAGRALPQNIAPTSTKEKLLRRLDCAVIEAVHAFDNSNYDSVRGMFIEGEPVYPGAGFHDKNHIQLCIRNLDCIKGYFRPL